jgi:hypothetical protein
MKLTATETPITQEVRNLPIAPFKCGLFVFSSKCNSLTETEFLMRQIFEMISTVLFLPIPLLATPLLSAWGRSSTHGPKWRAYIFSTVGQATGHG